MNKNIIHQMPVITITLFVFNYLSDIRKSRKSNTHYQFLAIARIITLEIKKLIPILVPWPFSQHKLIQDIQTKLPIV